MRPLLAAAVLALIIGGEAIADSLPQGTVTLTRARGDAIVVWDATSELAALVAQKPTKKDALQHLESEAALVFGNRAAGLKRTARTLTVLVLYTKTGAISPTYHVATFEGVERLFTFKARVNDSARASGWAEQLRAGRTVSGISVNVTGELPPELP